MSFRLLGYALLLILVVASTAAITSSSQQIPDDKYTGPRWEYRVLRLDALACREGDLTTPLNSLGRQGWELITSEQPAPAFPQASEGTMLIAPAARGPNNELSPPTPPTADSFQGNISIRMAEVPRPGCRLIFKREWHPPVSR